MGSKTLQQGKKENVTVLGWDPDAKEGLFTNNFDPTDDGKAAQNLYDEGADIVMPVAGPVGLGSALADELGSDKLKLGERLTQTDPARRGVSYISIKENGCNSFKCN